MKDCMKDWKTYALAVLAAWCAALTLGNPRSASVAPPPASASPTDCTDAPPVFDRNGASLSWTAGDGGLVLDCYCRVAPAGHCSALQRCRLSFSVDGRLANAELLPDRVCLLTDCAVGGDGRPSLLRQRHSRTPSCQDGNAAGKPLPTASKTQ